VDNNSNALAKDASGWSNIWKRLVEKTLFDNLWDSANNLTSSEFEDSSVPSELEDSSPRCRQGPP